MSSVLALLTGDRQADRAVPPSGMTARLTVLVSAVMAGLGVLALALALTADRAAVAWSKDLAGAASLRLPVAESAEAEAALAAAALRVLETSPGVASATVLDRAERAALLEPWIGAEMALEDLPLPGLIAVSSDPGDPYDAAGLQARLSAEVPGAVLDDHAAMRAPLIGAARRVRVLGLAIAGLTIASQAALVALAARAVLAANTQVIAVLRQVGARDIYIARAFVRRLTLRALLGAVVGASVGAGLVALWPAAPEGSTILPPLAFTAAEWLWCLVIPAVSAIVAFTATRRAALRKLEELG